MKKDESLIGQADDSIRHFLVLGIPAEQVNKPCYLLSTGSLTMVEDITTHTGSFRHRLPPESPRLAQVARESTERHVKTT